MELAAIYERISDDTEGRALGVDRQGQDCTALCQREELTVFDRYRDNDISASTKSRKRRPEYERLLADAKAGKFTVIVAATSGRLTRRPREHEDLIDLSVEYGVRFRYVSSPSFDLNTAAGRRIARTLAAQDAGEAEDIAERVAREVRQRAELGKFHGGPKPYGITPDGQSLVEQEAEEIRRWYSHVLAGGSLDGIRNRLNRQGVPSPTGKAWRTPVIRRILLHGRNAGLRVLNGITYPAPNPAIVPEATWRAAVAIIEDPRRRPAGHSGPARKHIGTGFFICQRCDCTVNASYDRRLNVIYRCLKCFRSWRAEPLHQFVDAMVEEMLGREDRRKRLLPRSTPSVNVNELRDEAAAIRVNLAELATEFALARGAVKEALRVGMGRGQARLDEIDQRLVAAGQVSAVDALLAADDPVAAYRDLDDIGRKQALLRSIMVVRLDEPIRGRAPWDPTKFLGNSKWTNDDRTWGSIWSS